MQNSVAKKLFALGSAAALALSLVPSFALAAAHSEGTNFKRPDGSVCMIIGGQARCYSSAGAFLSYGFNSWSSVVDASSEDLSLPQGSLIPPQDGKVFCAAVTKDTDTKGECSLISGGQKFPFTSAAVYTGNGFKFSRAVTGDSSFLQRGGIINNTTSAHLPGVLVNNNGTVQLVGTTGLMGIPDLTTFNSWGYSFNDVVPANMADKAMAQTGVMPARIAGQLSPTGVASVPGNTTTQSGPLTVSLASDNPSSTTVVAGQAIADLAHFTFNGSGTVTQVVLKRIGVSADDTLDAVYLYDGNNKITDAGSVSSGQVTFSNSSGIFTVSGSKTISVRADIKASVSGQTIGVQVTSYTVTGGSPSAVSVSGNLMSVADVSSNLATAKVTASTTITTSMDAGTMNTTIWGATFNISKTNVVLKYLKLKQIGSAPFDSLQNLQLIVAGSPIGSKVAVDSSGNIIFDLSGSPLKLQSGDSGIEVRADVIKGSSRTFTIQLQTASDVVFFDNNYGVNLLVAKGTNMSFPVASGKGATTISQGSLSVQTDASFTATQIIKNASNVVLGKWTLKAFGEDVKVQNLQVTLNYNIAPSSAEGFNNLTLYVNGAPVGSSQNALNPGISKTYTFGSTNLFTLPAGSTATFEIKGDLVLDSSTSVTWVRADLVVPSTSLQGVTSYNTLTDGPGTYQSTKLTVGTSQATLTKNTGYANQTISSNSTNQKIGSFVIQASSIEDIRVTSLTASTTAVLNNGTNSYGINGISNIYIKVGTYASNPVKPSSNNNFSVDFTVAANQNTVVDVFADVTNATGTIQTSFSGTATGKSSNQSVTLASSYAAGQLITVGSGSLLSITNSAAASPVSSYVAGGTTNQAIATFNAKASTAGSVTITELGFLATSTGAITAVSVNGSPTSTVAGTYALVSGLSLVVPVGNAGLNIPVTVNYATTGTNGVADQAVTLTLAHVKYTSGSQTTTLSTDAYNTASGNSDATSTLLGLLGATSTTMSLVGSYPTLSVASTNNAGLALNEQKLIDVVVTPNAAGAVQLNTMVFNVAYSGITGTPTFASPRLTIGSNTVSGSTCTPSGTYVVSCTLPASYYITSATTFSLYGTIGGTLGSAGQSSVTTSLGTASTFSWTDITGDSTIMTTSNTTYLANYPTQSWYIHN